MNPTRLRSPSESRVLADSPGRGSSGLGARYASVSSRADRWRRPSGVRHAHGHDVLAGLWPTGRNSSAAGPWNRPGFMVMGMLAPSVDAAAQRHVVGRRSWPRRYSGTNAGFDVVVTPILESLVGDYRRPLDPTGQRRRTLSAHCVRERRQPAAGAWTQRQRELAVRTRSARRSDRSCGSC